MRRMVKKKERAHWATMYCTKWWSHSCFLSSLSLSLPSTFLFIQRFKYKGKHQSKDKIPKHLKEDSPRLRAAAPYVAWMEQWQYLQCRNTSHSSLEESEEPLTRSLLSPSLRFYPTPAQMARRLLQLTSAVHEAVLKPRISRRGKHPRQ